MAAALCLGDMHMALASLEVTEGLVSYFYIVVSLVRAAKTG